MAQSFSASVDAWTRESEARLTAVFRDAAQTVANDVREPVGAGGHMPVDTGNLRRSLMASTSEIPTISNNADQRFAGNDQQINLVIAGAEIGQTIYLGFQANYAAHMEYGTSPHVIEPKEKLALHWYQNGTGVFAKKVHHPGTRPFGFVRLTAARWPEIVSASVQRIRSRVEARMSGR